MARAGVDVTVKVASLDVGRAVGKATVCLPPAAHRAAPPDVASSSSCLLLRCFCSSTVVSGRRPVVPACLLCLPPFLPPQAACLTAVAVRCWFAAVAAAVGRLPVLHDCPIPLVLLPTRLLLAGARKHGGPVEVLYQLTPVMSLTLMLLSLGHEQLWTRLPASPYFATVWMGLLSFTLIFAGAIIAFAMVVAEFALIANTSALTFMVAGTFKEIVTGGRSGYEAGCVMRGVVHGRRGRLCCKRQGCSGGRDEGGWAEAFAASPWQQGNVALCCLGHECVSSIAGHTADD